MPEPPLVIYGPAPRTIPVDPLFAAEREGRPLYVVTRAIALRTQLGWLRIPRGYVTDFGSIPGLAALLTLLMLQPLGRHAWAALAHDWLYAIGEPGLRQAADGVFLDRMKLDGVGGLKRSVMHAAVRAGGGGPYARARSWWDSENFADPETGLYPTGPPFGRLEAYRGQRWGLRPDPDWIEGP